ncbi:uncharacterized protein BDR25DRAFT_397577 [Lindgomyces ingoldianus]|uniref:Uncharacterized protein n=1 Tax=Lindgomyces ingoldianus TaxID=673940 RepID=A0ACB6Q8J0_9PLEO|nr:uncharacterized protein BDR25DRAFT_397577 [Lindgomyces ingoldianus]KAF2462500.1 hypothetical protein BDR25DRAFT_397577 [Lindgomyces ingoldianus]
MVVVEVVVDRKSKSTAQLVARAQTAEPRINAMSPARKWWSAGGALVAGAAMRARDACARRKIKIHRAVRVAAKHHHIWVLFDGFQSFAARLGDALNGIRKLGLRKASDPWPYIG